ncbi:TadE/TadG family type IV pilus assembly protein [Flexivirga lutea]
MNRNRCSRNPERGASIVEFAIVLPLLLLLIGGMVDFGRLFYTEVMLTNAAREGTRAAMYGNSPTTRATAALSGKVSSATVGPTQVCAPGATTGTASVTVSVPFQWTLLKPAMALFGGSIADPTLTGKATMQCGG